MITRSTVLRGLPSLVAASLAALAVALVVPSSTGCSSSTSATSKPAAGRCTPGNYVFCRCQDRQEGTKLCNEDGNSFGKCEPCETDTNPEVDPGPDPEPTDGGTNGDTGPAAVCGDKIVQDGEDCDDGNAVNDDGCDDKCKLAGLKPASTIACPGMDVHVWGKPVTWLGSTADAPYNFTVSPSCPSAAGNVPTSGANGKDRILKVTAHKTGTMTVASSDVNHNSFLFAMATCSIGTVSYITCANKIDGIGGETISFPVDAGKTYTVVVDGAGIGGNQDGNFRLTLSIQ